MITYRFYTQKPFIMETFKYPIFARPSFAVTEWQFDKTLFWDKWGETDAGVRDGKPVCR